MNRRRFLRATGAGMGALAGCSSTSERESRTPTETPPSTETATSSTEEPSRTDTPRETGTSEEDRNTIFVAPDGVWDDTEGGTEEKPLGSIQLAVKRAEPGETVHVKPGQYFQSVNTVRPGTATDPITITGPPDAVVSGEKGAEYAKAIGISHSHVHVTGLTIDGLQDPSRPDDPSSYMRAGITTMPEKYEYLTDLVIKPHAVGNVRGNAIHVAFAENVEVGEFRVIGPAGLRYLLTDKVGHWGEIVYLGQSPLQEPNEIEKKGELAGLDTSNNIYVHHIDNSEGHGHAELVNAKLGTHDVLVEYCTDGGGSQNTETYPSASVSFQSYGATVRWCDLRNGKGHGVEVGSLVAAKRQKEKSESELTEAERRGGTDNAIYGNRVTGFDDKAFVFPRREKGQTPEAQRLFCNNEYDGQTDGNPGASCPESVPVSNGIGHTGGDSPRG